MEDQAGLSTGGGPGCMERYAGDSWRGEGGDVGFKGFSGGDFVDGGHVCFGSYLVSRWLGDVGEDVWKI